MSIAYPLPRQTRQAILTAGAGQTTFGPFDFILFDPSDVTVLVKTATTSYARLDASQYLVTPAAPAAAFPGLFTVSLATPRAAGDTVWIKGTRLGSRTTDVTRAGILQSQLLETELDVQVVTEQELRRDIDAMQGSLPVNADNILRDAVAARNAAQAYATLAASSADALGNQVRQYDTRALAAAATIPVGVQAIKVTRYAAGYPLSYATYIPGTAAGPGAFQEAGGRWWELDISGWIVLVCWFGAAGNGVADDTAAFRGAAATGRSLFAPAGAYKLTDTITLTGNGQRLIGAGSIATIIVPSMAVDCIAFSGGNRGGGVEDLQIRAAGMTGGHCISINTYDRASVRNVALLNAFNGFFITACNGCILSDVYVDDLRGTYGIKWYGSSTARSDVLSLINMVMSGRSAVGIIMDGNVNTLRMHGVGLTAMKSGLVTQNTTGGPIPAFIVAHDLEVDYPTEQAIYLSGGFRGGYFTNTYVFGSQTKENIDIDAASFDISFTGGVCAAASRQGMIANGRYIRVLGMNIFANGASASNTLPGIAIGASSIGVTIQANHIGLYSGQAAETQNYGVTIEAGASEYRVIGNDMVGNVTGAVLDNANDYSFTPPRSAVALNGGSNLQRFGSMVLGSNPAVDTLSFWGQPPTTQQTVTGSTGGNAALSSLIAILVGYGLIKSNVS